MTVKEFLDKHLINPDKLDMDELCSYIKNEMQNGLENKKSSMPMINSFCSPEFTIQPEKSIAVIDAGGTNFRTCLVSFDIAGNAEISDFRKSKMPGSEKEVSAKEFFSIIADEIERLVDKTNRIGFCFSYAAKILEDHDGVPLIFSKEIKAPEVIGKHLGKELFAELTSRGHDMSEKKIIILNDTVTTLLAGLPKAKALGCEGCIGFILGTGTNCAYIHGDTIINEESGNLTIELGDIDKEFINSTKDPSSYHFEKMISGAYLGKSVSLIIKHAYNEGLISQTFDFDTREMSDFIEDKTNEIKNPNLCQIIESFISRAAKLTAASLAATVLMTEFGKNKPVLINADGTTFYKTKGLAEKTEFYLNEYLAKFGRKAVFTQIENAPIIGSAIGALSL